MGKGMGMGMGVGDWELWMGKPQTGCPDRRPELELESPKAR